MPAVPLVQGILRVPPRGRAPQPWLSAVPAGQIDAGRAVGLHRGAINRFIVIPQALRVILPPLGTPVDPDLSKSLGVGGSTLVPVAENSIPVSTGDVAESAEIGDGIRQ